MTLSLSSSSSFFCHHCNSFIHTQFLVDLLFLFVVLFLLFSFSYPLAVAICFVFLVAILYGRPNIWREAKQFVTLQISFAYHFVMRLRIIRKNNKLRRRRRCVRRKASNICTHEHGESDIWNEQNDMPYNEFLQPSTLSKSILFHLGWSLSWALIILNWISSA